MTGVEADRLGRDMIEAAGFGENFGHGLGHGVGVEIHEAPRLSTESTHTLEVGNVITIEPGIYLPGLGGVRIEDLAVVREHGVEILTQLPEGADARRMNVGWLIAGGRRGRLSRRPRRRRRLHRTPGGQRPPQLASRASGTVKRVEAYSFPVLGMRARDRRAGLLGAMGLDRWPRRSARCFSSRGSRRCASFAGSNRR